MTDKGDKYKSFRFKQFTIRHTDSAMKVGTDAVLLGAWTNFENPHNLLDIGTGSGILAMMMAQRHEKAQITAVEIDANASEEAKFNVQNSTFNSRIKVFNLDIKQWLSEEKFDAIICNPPFFNSSLKAKSESRSTARHTDTLNSEQLISLIFSFLHVNGSAALILPIGQLEEFQTNLIRVGLHVKRLCRVKGHRDKPAKRVLIQIGFREVKSTETELIIESSRHIYTAEFSELVKDFYL